MNTPKSPSEEPVSDLKPASKRSWRVRWSMRAFFVLVTLTCILFAWGSYLARVGQTHEEVADQLAVLGKATPTYAHRRSRIDVQWKYTVKVTKQTISGRTWNRITSSPTNIVLQTQYEKGVPKWMENTQTGLLFQRIDTIESKGPLRPEELEEFLGLVAQLDRLESLRLGEYLDNPTLTQTQLATLLSEVRLNQLEAPRSHLNAGPFPELRNTRLQYLDLSHTWFSDPAIADLPSTLEELILERTAVTDAGLEHFGRLKRLQYLNIKRTPTSEEAVEALREKMPWCHINWTPLKNP